MNRRWTPQEAWAWWDSRPWMMGLNYVPSCTPGYNMYQEDTREEAMKTVLPELDLMQEIGFNSVRLSLRLQWWVLDGDKNLDFLDELFEEFHKRGMGVVPILGNDCVGYGRPADINFHRPHGPEKFDLGFHSGHASSPFTGGTEQMYGWSHWDDDEYRKVCYDWVHAMMKRFSQDPRIDMWDMWNEPGMTNRGGLSIPYLQDVFEIARCYDPIAPLTACVWDYPDGYGVDKRAQLEEVARVAIDLSDIITFHSYLDFDKVQAEVRMLEREKRPIANTEWLHRIQDNFVQDNLPFYFEKKIGSYHWGLVAGNSQHYLPWDNIRNNPKLDYTRWQHDIIRQDGKTPYDPEEIALFKKFGAMKDQAGAKEARPTFFEAKK